MEQSDQMEELTQKVQRVALELIQAKRDRQHLTTENTRLREQLKEFHLLSKENDHLRGQQDHVRVKLERLNRKLEKLSTPVVAFPELISGGNS